MLDAAVDVEALFVAIPQTPLHIFHFCPPAEPRSDALSDLLNVSITEASAVKTYNPNVLAPADILDIIGIKQNLLTMQVLYMLGWLLFLLL